LHSSHLHLKLRESLDRLTASGELTQNVESDLILVSAFFTSLEPQGVAYGLAERPALANGDLVTLLNTKGGGDVCSQVGVSLLVPRVLGDEVKIFSADNEGTVHLGRNNGAGQDTATDRDETGERALLVCKAILESPYSFPARLLLLAPANGVD
jgi:hypothetical protein